MIIEGIKRLWALARKTAISYKNTDFLWVFAAGNLCAIALLHALWDCTALYMGAVSGIIRALFDAGVFLTVSLYCLLLRGAHRKNDGCLFLSMVSVCAVFGMAGMTAVVRLIFALLLMLYLTVYELNRIRSGCGETDVQERADGAAYYKNIEERYLRSRELWHDMRNHIALLNSYINNGSYEEMKAYTADFCDELEKAILPFNTGNMAADTILGDKAYLARRHRICVDMHIAPLGALTMAPVDLCVVLGNLLDNAVEACLKVEENGRYIKIGAAWNGESCYFSVENSCISCETLKSSKLNSSRHGIGLRSVERVIHKYGGVFLTVPSEGRFKAVAELR